MWEESKKKIEQLAALDKQRQVFGASNHDYHLYNTLTEDDIATFEDWLGARFPEELRAFYREVGNGVAGPHYGLLEAHSVRGYRPAEPYTEAATLRGMSGDGSESTSEYFEISHDQITGLIVTIEAGCGHEICLVTTGARAGEVVHVSLEGYVQETGENLVQTYNEWLDRELGKFDLVVGLMRSGATLEEINAAVNEKYESYDAEDVIVSIADVEKPAELFGTGGSRIYHGATQTPWYESVLREWREANS
jgi:hypothetical protein